MLEAKQADLYQDGQCTSMVRQRVSGRLGGLDCRLFPDTGRGYSQWVIQQT